MKTPKYKPDRIFLRAAEKQFNNPNFTCFTILDVRHQQGEKSEPTTEWYSELFSGFEGNNIRAAMRTDHLRLHHGVLAIDADIITQQHVQECRLMCLLLADIILNEEKHVLNT